MFAWASQTEAGGLYRLRYTGRPAYLPIGLNAESQGMRISFTDPLQPKAATDPKNYTVTVWSLKRTANYGSKHYDEHTLEVTAARLSPDGKQVMLTIPNIAPTWCMEIKYALQDPDGNPVTGTIHNTIHHLKP